MSVTETYQHLLAEIKRLTSKKLSEKEYEAIFEHYIYSRVSDADMLKAMRGVSGQIKVTLPEGLRFAPILKQTQKIIMLMEVSDSWAEFEKLGNKDIPKKPDNDLTDFDKILQAILEVPKEDKPPN